MPDRGAVILAPASSAAAESLTTNLADGGAPLVLVDNDHGTLLRRSQQAPAGTNVISVEGDLADTQTGQAACRAASRHGHSVAAMILAADELSPIHGTGGPADVEEVTQRLYALIRPAVAGMREGGWGRVILLLSPAWLGVAGQLHRSAAAAAAAGFVRALALESGKHGITVNAISQAYVDYGDDPDLPERAARSTAVRHAGEPEDLVAAVEFLLSDKARFMTGQVLSLCGGSTIGKSIY